MRNVIYLILFIFISCKEHKESNVIQDINSPKEQIETKEYLSKELDKLLFCGKFDIREEYYRVPDNGCLYDSVNNNLGNSDVIIIPKTERFSTTLIDSICSDDIDCINKTYNEISSLSLKDFKNNFNALIFIVNKKYLKHTSHLDQSYNPQIPYTITSYVLNDYIWIESSKFDVNNEDNIGRINDWKMKIIEDVIKTSSIKKTIPNSIKSNNKIEQKWIGNYERVFSEKFTDGTTTFWKYIFLINNEKIIFKSDAYPSEEIYLAVEKDNLLELYDNVANSKKSNPNFILKKENDKIYIKGSSFQNEDKWLLFEKEK